MSSAVRWLIWCVPDDLRTTWPASSSRRRIRSAPGLRWPIGRRAAGRRLLCLAAAERDELARLRREVRQLRLERDILSKAAAWFVPGDRDAAVRVFRFMSANQACFPIAPMARVLGVSKAGYYAWRHRCPSAHTVADAALLKRVRTVHASSRQTYGAPRVHADLRAQGERHGRKRIARLMRDAGLVGACHRRGGPTTTQRDKEVRPAPDLVDRNFTASGPNQLWIADITYLPTAAGFLYLAVVLDVWSRKPDAERPSEVVGWSMANHLRAELVLDALEMAVGQQRPKDVVHHSDQGFHEPDFSPRCIHGVLKQLLRVTHGKLADAGSDMLAVPTAIIRASHDGHPMICIADERRRLAGRPSGSCLSISWSAKAEFGSLICEATGEGPSCLSMSPTLLGGLRRNGHGLGYGRRPHALRRSGCSSQRRYLAPSQPRRPL